MKNPQGSKSTQENNENDYVIGKSDSLLVLCHLSLGCFFYGLSRSMYVTIS